MREPKHRYPAPVGPELHISGFVKLNIVGSLEVQVPGRWYYLEENHTFEQKEIPYQGSVEIKENDWFPLYGIVIEVEGSNEKELMIYMYIPDQGFGIFISVKETFIKNFIPCRSVKGPSKN